MFRRLVTTLIASALLSLPFISLSSPAEASLAQSWKVDRMVKNALAQRGDRYSWGAAGPSRFDCSGLIYYSVRKGMGPSRLPRTSSQLAASRLTKRISNPRRGDLVFFHNGGRVYHVAIYWGNGYMLNSSNTGNDVRIERIWKSRARFYERIV